ncbi:MAG: hypothetical protein IJS50_05535, partial [Desulfovibrio sp.]|nr:hypothetical protein [Desulfovibrio sp.]
MDMVLERTVLTTSEKISAAKTLEELLDTIRCAFGILPAGEIAGGSSEYGLKAKGIKTREKLNEQCREILARVQGDAAALSEEDRKILLQYSGRGGLTKNSQYEYYTPTFLAEGVWGALQAQGFTNGNVLEPACGHGVFLGTKPSGVIMSANDLDPVGSGITALLNPKDKVSNRPFEEVVMSTEDDTFDSAIGNVPFGNARGASLHLDPAYKSEKSIERYFLLRALDKIRPGGLACFICPTNIVGNRGAKWSQFRIALSKKAEFLGAHKLPSKTFAAQGTDTVVDVVVLRKHSRDIIDRLKANEIPLETLKESKLIWDEFVGGKYWQGEGRPFIMGRYVPKVAGDHWSREAVEGPIDEAQIKQALARKFHSRINWELLNAAEPNLTSYAIGDQRYIEGVQYEYTGGSWEKVLEVDPPRTLEVARYGAATLQGLQGILSSPLGALGLTLAQAKAVVADFPKFLNSQEESAVRFALAQAEECQEQVYRGSILGQMLEKLGVDEAGGEDVSLRRKALQEAIVAEIEKYGHPANNKKLNLIGGESQAYGLFKNSVDTQGNFSALLSGKIERSGQSFDPTKVDEIVQYLFSRDETPIEFEDVKNLYRGEIKLKTLADLADNEFVAITPDGTLMPLDRYCSGDVMIKMQRCLDAATRSEDDRLAAKYKAQIARMQSKMRKTKLEDMTFSLQDKWYSPELMVRFLRENGYADAAYRATIEEDVEQADGTWVKKEKSVVDRYDVPGGSIKLGFARKSDQAFTKQLEKYLAGGNVTSSKAENISEYRDRVKLIEQQYDSWIRQQPDIDDLANEYNLRFNSFVPFEYDTSSLGMEDVFAKDIDLHTYQNAEVRRLADQGSGICGFNVGLGKSFMALALAAYNAKHGRAMRTCIVVPSAVLENWYHEARTLYSESYMRQSVFFVGLKPSLDAEGKVLQKPLLDEEGKPRVREDGTPIMQDVLTFTKSPQEIYDAMWQIPQSNFKLVVMTKEKFKEIPLRPETIQSYTDTMVENGMTSLGKSATDKKKSYADDKKISKMIETHSDEGTKKKKALPYLEDMGFNSILSDESHFFKNSLQAGNLGGIAYLQNPTVSQIAKDMSIKCDYIRKQNNGRGVYGLTATPVTNSPLEIFNMLSLVTPLSEFQRFGVSTPEDFVHVFGEIKEI